MSVEGEPVVDRWRGKWIAGGGGGGGGGGVVVAMVMVVVAMVPVVVIMVVVAVATTALAFEQLTSCSPFCKKAMSAPGGTSAPCCATKLFEICDS